MYDQEFYATMDKLMAGVLRRRGAEMLETLKVLIRYLLLQPYRFVEWLYDTFYWNEHNDEIETTKRFEDMKRRTRG